MTIVATTPFLDQVPGTSGLRKKVSVFQQKHYLENYVQSIFDTLRSGDKKLMVLGGDGRFYNNVSIQTIISMAKANGVRKVMVGKQGILSTPAASLLIRKNAAGGGFILSASHNPAGVDQDFGIKFNSSNGAPAAEIFCTLVAERARNICTYRISSTDTKIDISQCGLYQLGDMLVEVVDSVDEYKSLMNSLFDFDQITYLFESQSFKMCFDSMSAVTGPYAVSILESCLKAPVGTVINAVPLDDFGGGHPDPNLVHAKELLGNLKRGKGKSFGAASDGDGDRNLILGEGFYVNPCDSLAVIAANAHHIPMFSEGLTGVARSMPTSRALDRVAKQLGIPCYETPTGWKYFANLLDEGCIQLCGEESFGTGGNHIREKDGLWAVLCWLNIMAVRKMTPEEILTEHWLVYGRDYFTRHDYESVDAELASQIIAGLSVQINGMSNHELGSHKIISVDDFQYTDPIDKSVSLRQGIRIFFENNGRIVLRLSGTGTEGATLRLYFDYHEKDQGKLDIDPQIALEGLLKTVCDMPRILELTGNREPDVIT